MFDNRTTLMGEIVARMAVFTDTGIHIHFRNDDREGFEITGLARSTPWSYREVLLQDSSRRAQQFSNRQEAPRNSRRRGLEITPG